MRAIQITCCEHLTHMSFSKQWCFPTGCKHTNPCRAHYHSPRWSYHSRAKPSRTRLVRRCQSQGGWAIFCSVFPYVDFPQFSLKPIFFDVRRSVHMPNTVSAKMSSADRVYVEVAGESTRMSLKDTSPSTHVHEPFCDRSSVVPGPCASRKHCPYTLLQPDSILQIQGCSSRARRPQAQGEVSSKRVKERKQWLQAATGRGQRARKRTNLATLKFFFFFFFFFFFA